ncbi:SURF1 family protein [Pseudacidovorax intermedius]|uniref:SURF1-like protein n=1 Tax=Pseudacidovorax intermedius TaxID=433924 RepID=A0A147H7I0_9BURK|nr:SURF1 family protein [Pseudacidovorax intermedius]KTT25917.1 hypothetical protein NS331_04145 [Pseudacidovorax intermedius]
MTQRRRGLVLVPAAALFFVLLMALGTWQVYRLGWKRDLIARVDARVHAAPMDAPGRARWPAVSAEADEYRRVRLEGRFLADKEALVQATTDLGAGFWLLVPLQRADGSLVWVNRGFLPPEARAPGARGRPSPEGIVQVEGLLRLTEPGGAFLRHNDPAAGRWYSRDVAALSAAHGLEAADTAPFFVDARRDPGQAEGSWPVGGLTVIRFPNNHLMYAITWYGMALMLLGGLVYAWRRGAFGQDDNPAR